MEWKKKGAKKQGQKREKAAWSLLFLNKNNPVFAPHNLSLFFKDPDPRK